MNRKGRVLGAAGCVITPQLETITLRGWRRGEKVFISFRLRAETDAESVREKWREITWLVLLV